MVDEHSTQTKPEPKNHRTHILKSDWFWYTIQNGYADEMDYLFGDVSNLCKMLLKVYTNHIQIVVL